MHVRGGVGRIGIGTCIVGLGHPARHKITGSIARGIFKTLGEGHRGQGGTDRMEQFRRPRARIGTKGTHPHLIVGVGKQVGESIVGAGDDTLVDPGRAGCSLVLQFPTGFVIARNPLHCRIFIHHIRDGQVRRGAEGRGIAVDETDIRTIGISCARSQGGDIHRVVCRVACVVQIAGHTAYTTAEERLVGSHGIGGGGVVVVDGHQQVCQTIVVEDSVQSYGHPTAIRHIGKKLHIAGKHLLGGGDVNPSAHIGSHCLHHIDVHIPFDGTRASILECQCVNSHLRVLQVFVGTIQLLCIAMLIGCIYRNIITGGGSGTRLDVFGYQAQSREGAHHRRRSADIAYRGYAHVV